MSLKHQPPGRLGHLLKARDRLPPGHHPHVNSLQSWAVGEGLASFLLQGLLPLPGPNPMEMALDFTASPWELTNHQIYVVPKTCILRAMGEVTGALLLAHPYTEKEIEALRGPDSSPIVLRASDRICLQESQIWAPGSYPSF